eukprot:177023-Pelagomonas_calceolata.AAC.1
MADRHHALWVGACAGVWGRPELCTPSAEHLVYPEGHPVGAANFGKLSQRAEIAVLVDVMIWSRFLLVTERP